MSNYYEMDDFKNIYLEDSFVLGIEESEDELFFIVEMVLTEAHPLYTPPNASEQYCYKTGKIGFQELKSVEWLNRNTKPITDAEGSEDYGNIDSFTISPEGYYLEGYWGEVKINSSPPKVVWL